MRRKKNNVLQLCVLGALGISVMITLLFPYISANMHWREPLEISAVMRDTDNRLWSGLRMGMEQAASDLGVELRFLSPTSGEVQEQEEFIKKEMERGTDALVVMPVDSSYLEEAIHLGEIPVIALESPLQGSRKTISPDNEQLGRGLAQLACQQQKEGTVLLVSSYPRSAGVQKRVEEARQTLENAGIQVKTYMGTDFSELSHAAETIQAEQILALDSRASLLLTEGYEGQKTHPKLYGVGTMGEITAGLEKGVLSGIAAWSEYAAGYLAVESAVNAIQRKGSDAQGTLRVSIIKEDEIYEPENQKLLFPVIS